MRQHLAHKLPHLCAKLDGLIKVKYATTFKILVKNMTIEGEFTSIRVLQGIYPPTLYFKINLKNRGKVRYNFFAYKRGAN